MYIFKDSHDQLAFITISHRARLPVHLHRVEKILFRDGLCDVVNEILFGVKEDVTC